MRQDTGKYEDDAIRPGLIVRVLEDVRVPVVGEVDGQRVLRSQANVYVLSQ